jgi:CPA1 family monovalent cation:H+ antiporter
MNLFDLASVLVALTAVFGYLNHRLLRLPSGTGIFALSLLSSLLLLGINAWKPEWGLRDGVGRFLARIDFTSAFMHGMLCFLLFAGALQVDFQRLRADRWTILLLATAGVLISTALIGFLASVLFNWLGLDVPPVVCFVLGALISPTDPVAVLALLKTLAAPPDLEAQIAGESLFNDGVGVVVFFAFISLAGLDVAGPHAHLALNVGSLASFFFRQVGGGVLLGLGAGGLAFAALRGIEDHVLELLVTIATVMLMYTLSFPLGVSGPIAVVVAGIFMGGWGRRLAMSNRTKADFNTFWSLVDELLNSALFLFLGLQVLVVAWNGRLIGAGLLLIPIVLAARWISVAVPVGLLGLGRPFRRGLVPILTWGGLRGGLSVAMVLSLPDFPQRDLLVSGTYLVMLFSVLIQGTTMRRLLRFYEIGPHAQSSMIAGKK